MEMISYETIIYDELDTSPYAYFRFIQKITSH